MARYLLTTLLFLMNSYELIANELHLVINGKAIHFDNQDWNEENWGLGFEYQFEPRDTWIPLVAGSAFLDSNKNVSKYLGAGMKKRYSLTENMHFDLGFLGFLMTRADYRDNRPFAAVLPFISVGTDRYAINVTYIPAVKQKMIDLLYFQATIKI